MKVVQSGGHNDDRFDAMLRRQAGAGAQARRDCPDSALIAAYHERSLSPLQRTRIDDHLSGCARCRAELVALAAAEDAATASLSGLERTRRRALGRWIFSPWTAAAVAGGVAVVIAVGLGTDGFRFGAAEPAVPIRENKIEPRQLKQEVETPGASTPESAASRLEVPRNERAKAAPVPDLKLRRPFAASIGHPTKPSAPNAAVNAPSAATPPAPGAAAPRAGLGATGAGAASATGAIMPGAAAGTRPLGAPGAGAGLSGGAPIASNRQMAEMAAPASAALPAWVRSTVAPPDGSIRWLVGSDGRIERVMTGAPPKMLHSGVSAELLAGSAPSASVCWIAGRNGTVIRTVDGGDTWTVATPPTNGDLVTISARNAFVATVVTADSRRYSTANGGQTWQTQ